MSDLGRLLAPSSIAIAGLSADHTKHGRRVLGHLQKLGFAGPVYGVNPGLPEVVGVEMVASLRDLETPPDLVVSAVPATATVPVVESAAGVGGVVVFAGGFGESGDVGRAHEADLRSAASDTGVRLLGPNSGGVIRPGLGLAASFLTCLDRPTEEIRSGRVGLVTQSGGTGSYIHNLAAARGAGLAISVSTGNEVDIKLGEAIGAVAQLEEVDVLLVVMETVRDGEAFIESVRGCHQRGKPVVVCRIGTGSLGQRMMRSHTGAMALPGRVVDGVLRHLGVTVAATPEEAYEVAQTVAELGPHGSRAGIVTHSGGVAILLADLADEGVDLPAPGPNLSAAVEPLLDHGVVANPLDMGGIIGGPGRFAEVVQAFADSGDFDVVVAVSTAHPPAHTSERVESLVSMRTDVPVLQLWMAGDQGDEGLRRLRDAAVPVSTEPRAAIKALGVNAPTPSDERMPPLASEFSDWGLPLIDESIAHDREAAVNLAESVGFPVVVKLVSSEVDHKTDAGGVRLDLRSADEVRVAFEEVIASADAAGLEVSGVSVSRFRPGLELIVGGHIDRVFGPVVSVGFGGIATEVIGDISFAPAPATHDEARAMIEGLRLRPLLDGVRGQAPADIDALARILVQVSRGIAGGRYAELEINPLIWDGEWIAVDVLAVER
ncbi:MAG TPA: acetate--CoA ligase family protein [Acidimicrobiia bacterium]|nr:acetate--CoA ligase family protein [Acidimicrobiia bacterium]